MRIFTFSLIATLSGQCRDSGRRLLNSGLHARQCVDAYWCSVRPSRMFCQAKVSRKPEGENMGEATAHVYVSASPAAAFNLLATIVLGATLRKHAASEIISTPRICPPSLRLSRTAHPETSTFALHASNGPDIAIHLISTSAYLATVPFLGRPALHPGDSIRWALHPTYTQKRPRAPRHLRYYQRFRP
jgi:hypothetical protein